MAAPEENREFDWGQLAPNLRENEEELARLCRQIRVSLGSGRTPAEVSAELVGSGVAEEVARELVAHVQQGGGGAYRLVGQPSLPKVLGRMIILVAAAVFALLLLGALLAGALR
jgi:hypothetical protein